MRRTDGCINCAETREIAAHGLCFKCYRSNQRASDRRYANVDRHNPGVRRDHKKLLRGFTGVICGLANLGAGFQDVLAIRRIIEPYLEPVTRFLALQSEQNQEAVNSEHDSQEMFTVHRGSGSHPARVNSDAAALRDAEG